MGGGCLGSGGGVEWERRLGIGKVTTRSGDILLFSLGTLTGVFALLVYFSPAFGKRFARYCHGIGQATTYLHRYKKFIVVIILDMVRRYSRPYCRPRTGKVARSCRYPGGISDRNNSEHQSTYRDPVSGK